MLHNGSDINAEPSTQPYCLYDLCHRSTKLGRLAHLLTIHGDCFIVQLMCLSCKHADHLFIDLQTSHMFVRNFLQIHIVMPVRSRLKNIMAATSKYIDGIYVMLQLQHGQHT